MVTPAWRCGSPENRRAATFLVLHDGAPDACALVDLVPTGTAVASLAVEAADAPAIALWLDEAAGDAEELWLVAVRRATAAAAALVRLAPDRFDGIALVGGDPVSTAVVRALDGCDRLVVDAPSLPPLPASLQCELAVWFAARFAREPLPITRSSRRTA